MNSLDGKTILVTGASRGIGAATAAACRSAGAQVLAHASRASVNTDESFLYADFSEENSGHYLFQAALERVERIDGVVNNAGMFLETPLAGERQRDWSANWKTTMAVNVQAPADICRAAIEHYRRHGGGRIVNVASRAGHRGDVVEGAAYAASKGALLAMTKSWARGLSQEQIHLYSIAPGWVETQMAPAESTSRTTAVSEIPLGRFAHADEVANAIVFLLSDACISAVGATIDINGASYVR